MSGDCIIDRIDTALEKVRARQMEVRAIYLTSKDHDAFDKAMRKRLKVRGSFLAYGDHQIPARRAQHHLFNARGRRQNPAEPKPAPQARSMTLLFDKLLVGGGG